MEITGFLDVMVKTPDNKEPNVKIIKDKFVIKKIRR